MKIYLDTIGCRLNQAEIEQMARQFRTAGHEIVAAASEADLAVVNTCTVTSEAAADSRSKIRQAAHQGVEQIVATGCWATLEPDQAAGLPGVSRIVPNPDKDSLAAELLGLPREFFDLEPIARQPLPGLHARTRAFIKVQDGCDNACTFCITTVARGNSRSRPVEAALTDMQAALDGGTQEIVLTGVHLGAWGQDFDPPRRLVDLVSTLLTHTSVPRLRLSSLEPWDLEADFFSLWRDPRLCRHLHLPLQSGSASVLRRMRRRTSPDAFAALVGAARAAIPGAAITTDIIVGFPGESEAEFAETLDFVKAMEFSGGHVFTYSARPGTPAARMKNQTRGDMSKVRSARLRAVLAEASMAYRRGFIGQTLPVLWESTSQLSDSGWQMEGLTDNYLRVRATAPQPRWNRLEAVQLINLDGDGLAGEIIKGHDLSRI
jgi:threonylcarbamoyladenosine tRNA methylthiotransferase MtaB